MNQKIVSLKNVVDRTVNVLGHVQYYLNQATFALIATRIFLEKVSKEEFGSGYIKEQ
jgi:hypothetical protein